MALVSTNLVVHLAKLEHRIVKGKEVWEFLQESEAVKRGFLNSTRLKVFPIHCLIRLAVVELLRSFSVLVVESPHLFLK